MSEHFIMNLRKYLRESKLAREIYSRTWLARYAAAKLSRRRSFAQAGEDLKIQELIGNVTWFVDIGANDGMSSSNTFYFALRGARGVCFEPVRDVFIRLKWLYLFNWRVRVVRCGISDQNREAEIVTADFLSFLPETEDSCHNSDDIDSVDRHRKEKIVLRRFEDAVAGTRIPCEVDLLSVDVEGHEFNVLKAIPFDRYSFRAIVVETHLLNDDGILKWRHRDFAKIETLLAAYGYGPAHTTWVNTIYLRQRLTNTT